MPATGGSRKRASTGVRRKETRTPSASRRRITNDDQQAPSPSATVLVVPRENEFTSQHWWLVDLHAEPRLEQGATPLVRRCMIVHGWDEVKARKVLKAYRQFLHIKKSKEDWDAEV